MIVLWRSHKTGVFVAIMRPFSIISLHRGTDSVQCIKEIIQEVLHRAVPTYFVTYFPSSSRQSQDTQCDPSYVIVSDFSDQTKLCNEYT